MRSHDSWGKCLCREAHRAGTGREVSRSLRANPLAPHSQTKFEAKRTWRPHRPPPERWKSSWRTAPDSDDAFMFYALATNRVKVPGLKFTHVLADIETLNQAADRETYDVTAISFAAYAYLRDKYVLLDCGASFGEGYGPIVVAGKPMKRAELAGSRIGVPGLRTTAYLTLKLYEPHFEAVPIPFDQIIDAVRAGTVDAGLLIHEGQLLFPELGLHRVVDLGHWWQETTQLPLPLGGNAVRRAIGPEAGRGIAHAIRESVSYALEHRRGGAQLRPAICARHGSGSGGQVYRDVRQPLDAGIRRTRPRRRAGAPQSGIRGRPAARSGASRILERPARLTAPVSVIWLSPYLNYERPSDEALRSVVILSAAKDLSSPSLSS